MPDDSGSIDLADMVSYGDHSMAPPSMQQPRLSKEDEAARILIAISEDSAQYPILQSTTPSMRTQREETPFGLGGYDTASEHGYGHGQQAQATAYSGISPHNPYSDIRDADRESTYHNSGLVARRPLTDMPRSIVSWESDSSVNRTNKPKKDSNTMMDLAHEAVKVPKMGLPSHKALTYGDREAGIEESPSYGALSPAPSPTALERKTAKAGDMLDDLRISTPRLAMAATSLQYQQAHTALSSDGLSPYANSSSAVFHSNPYQLGQQSERYSREISTRSPGDVNRNNRLLDGEGLVKLRNAKERMYRVVKKAVTKKAAPDKHQLFPSSDGVMSSNSQPLGVSDDETTSDRSESPTEQSVAGRGMSPSVPAQSPKQVQPMLTTMYLEELENLIISKKLIEKSKVDLQAFCKAKKLPCSSKNKTVMVERIEDWVERQKAKPESPPQGPRNVQSKYILMNLPLEELGALVVSKKLIDYPHKELHALCVAKKQFPTRSSKDMVKTMEEWFERQNDKPEPSPEAANILMSPRSLNDPSKESSDATNEPTSTRNSSKKAPADAASAVTKELEPLTVSSRNALDMTKNTKGKKLSSRVAPYKFGKSQSTRVRSASLATVDKKVRKSIRTPERTNQPKISVAVEREGIERRNIRMNNKDGEVQEMIASPENSKLKEYAEKCETRRDWHKSKFARPNDLSLTNAEILRISISGAPLDINGNRVFECGCSPDTSMSYQEHHRNPEDRVQTEASIKVELAEQERFFGEYQKAPELPAGYAEAVHRSPEDCIKLRAMFEERNPPAEMSVDFTKEQERVFLEEYEKSPEDYNRINKKVGRSLGDCVRFCASYKERAKRDGFQNLKNLGELLQEYVKKKHRLYHRQPRSIFEDAVEEQWKTHLKLNLLDRKIKLKETLTEKERKVFNEDVEKDMLRSIDVTSRHMGHYIANVRHIGRASTGNSKDLMQP